MAEQLGSGLQNRVDRCNSGSRLGLFGMPLMGEWWNGIHDRLKICWASAHEGSTPSSPRVLDEVFGQFAPMKYGAPAAFFGGSKLCSLFMY